VAVEVSLELRLPTSTTRLVSALPLTAGSTHDRNNASRHDLTSTS
jgi:hypothetical protein